MGRSIKVFLTDVDGVLTDAGMYYTESGDEFKKFSTYDGMAFELLRQHGIKTGIITSESTKITEARARKIKADYLYQGLRGEGKLNAAYEICKNEGIAIDEIAYIGDDLNCIPLLEKAGLAACPKNAVEKVKSIQGILHLKLKGGEGVVREFVEIILSRATSGNG